MKVRAKDSISVTSVRADSIRRGEEFDVNEAEGKQLLARGLVERVAGKAKATPVPKNKVAPIAANKAKPSPDNK